MPDIVYTIGHSNHPIEEFLRLLKTHDITAVADARSHPFSRLHPQFNRERLQVDLQRVSIAYVFLGKELGARADNPDCYVDGKVQYDLLARTPLFQEGLGRLVQGAKKHRIALVCAEKDPLTCHRAILVCRHLESRGIQAHHILEDGRIENQDQALSRLIRELGLAENDLFRNREEIIQNAYELRGQEIAYARVDSAQALAGKARD